MRRDYCKKYTDYICVDAIAELINPNYVTDHFKVVLKEKRIKTRTLSRSATQLCFTTPCIWYADENDSGLAQTQRYGNNG